MMFKILMIISIGIAIWLILCRYYDCFKQKQIKTLLLRATREELGTAETREKSCLESLKLIDNEISVLRDQIKKVSEQSLKTCLTNFEKRIDVYDALQKRVFADQPESEKKKLILSREAIKRKFGIP